MAIKRSRINMFAKDPDVLPFFSIHPRTRVGTALRAILIVFILLTMLLVFLASKGFLFVWLYSLYYLIYLVPALIVAALVILALFKRMRSLFAKIAVPGVLGFFVLSIFLTLFTTMSSFYNLGIVPKSMVNVDGHPIVFMRTCETLGENETDEEGNPIFHYRLQFLRFTARVPEACEGQTYTIDGEIMIPDGAEYTIAPEWIDEDHLRFFISQDNSEMGHGEILVSFTSGETLPASPEASEDMKYLSTQESPQKTHKVFLYSQSAYEDLTTSSYMALSEERVYQLYTAAPASMRLFARSNRRVDGLIRLEPYSNLRVNYEWLEDDVLAIRPTEDCPGASGEIVIYFNEIVDLTATQE